MRIGIGHDTHQLEMGGPLILGGIEIPHDYHLVGHSDADVLLHAVTDAILGATAQGDIGELFPDTALENKGRDSAEMLASAAERVRRLRYSILNLDCIVFAQRPKLTPHKPRIQQRISTILEIAVDQVSVKAKTGEHVGPIGEEKVMMAQCVALVDKQQ